MQQFGLNDENSCVVVTNDSIEYPDLTPDSTNIIKVCPYIKKSKVDRTLCADGPLCTMLVYAMQKANVGIHLYSEISFI